MLRDPYNEYSSSESDINYEDHRDDDDNSLSNDKITIKTKNESGICIICGSKLRSVLDVCDNCRQFYRHSLLISSKVGQEPIIYKHQAYRCNCNEIAEGKKKIYVQLM